MDWRDEAACTKEDPELFFPTKVVGPVETQIAVAKAVCARCPVAAPCLKWAVDQGHLEGVWGGTSEDERRMIRREASRRRLHVA